MSSRSVLLALFWILGSVANNIWTKAALRELPFPFLLCCVGLTAMYVVQRLRRRGGVTSRSKTPPFIATLPVSLAVTCAFACHRLALSSGSIGLTITVKSMSTVFVAGGSYVFLDVALSLSSVLAVLAIVVGIATSSLADASFETSCFAFALTSGFAVSSKILLCKRILIRDPELDPGQLFSRTILVALLAMIPICAHLEGDALWHRFAIAGSDDVWRVAPYALRSAMGLAWMEIGSFAVLNEVTPVTHAVLNGARSLAIIVAGSVYFGTPMPIRKAAGVAIVIVGCVGYALGARQKKKKKRA